MADRNKLIHLHSGVLDKQPSASTIEYGEIAVNFNSEKPFVSFKVSGDSEASIVMCRPTPSIEDNGDNVTIDNNTEINGTLTVDEQFTAASLVSNSDITAASNITSVGGVITAPTISGTSITGPTISGTSITGPTISGTTIVAGNTVSGLTSVISPKISGTTISAGSTITVGTGITINSSTLRADYINASSITGVTISASTGFLGGTFSGSSISATSIFCSNVLTAPSFSGTTFHAGDGFYQDSDENLKNFDSDINVDLDKLKLIPKKYFYWKEGNADKQIGTSAQKVQEQFPEIVTTCTSETLAVDYAKLSIIALAAIDKLNDKIKALEEEINELKGCK